MSEDTAYIEEALGLLGLRPPSDKGFDENAFMASFLAWEAETDDTIDFKRAYVDMAGGDVLAGLALSQIIYWHLPGKNCRSKLSVYKSGHYWIAKEREDWWHEIRLSARQVDRCLKILASRDLIVVDHFRFGGLRTLHIRINWRHFAFEWDKALKNHAITKNVRPELPRGECGVTKNVRPLTETTSENTSSPPSTQTTQPPSMPAANDDDVSSELIALLDALNIKGKGPRAQVALATKEHGYTLDELERLKAHVLAHSKRNPAGLFMTMVSEGQRVPVLCNSRGGRRKRMISE